MFDGFGLWWVLLDQIGCFWNISGNFDHVRRSWIMLGSFGSCSVVLEHAGWSWIMLGGFGSD